MGYLLVNQICENYFSQFLNIGIHSKIRATNTTTYIYIYIYILKKNFKKKVNILFGCLL